MIKYKSKETQNISNLSNSLGFVKKFSRMNKFCQTRLSAGGTVLKERSVTLRVSNQRWENQLYSFTLSLDALCEDLFKMKALCHFNSLNTVK